MLTRKEQELVDYYYNRAMGKKVRRKKISEEPVKEEVKVEVNLDRLAEDICDRLWDII